MFHIIEKEMEWRRSQDLPEGFETLKKTKPLVAVGANAPLGDQRIMADYFRRCSENLSDKANESSDGKDGLAGVHESVREIAAIEATLR